MGRMKTHTVENIGRGLLEAAQLKERRPADVLDELFPFIYEASRRMSSREISRWLAESHAVEISSSTILRALREPGPFWERWAESVEPIARRVSEGLELPIFDVLFDDSDEFEKQWAIADADAQGRLSKGAREALVEDFELLRAKWFSLSPETRQLAADSFDFAESYSKEEGEE